MFIQDALIFNLLPDLNVNDESIGLLCEYIIKSQKIPYQYSIRQHVS